MGGVCKYAVIKNLSCKHTYVAKMAGGSSHGPEPAPWMSERTKANNVKEREWLYKRDAKIEGEESYVLKDFCYQISQIFEENSARIWKL